MGLGGGLVVLVSTGRTLGASVRSLGMAASSIARCTWPLCSAGALAERLFEQRLEHGSGDGDGHSHVHHSGSSWLPSFALERAASSNAPCPFPT